MAHWPIVNWSDFFLKATFKYLGLILNVSEKAQFSQRIWNKQTNTKLNSETLATEFEDELHFLLLKITYL